MLKLSVSEILHAARGALVTGDPSASVGGDSESGIRELPFPPDGRCSMPPVRGISTDSRQVSEGGVFFALKGDRFDGHDFLNEVIRKKAGLCVVSRIPAGQDFSACAVIRVKDTRAALADCARLYRLKYGRGTRIIGISGSCGKTTVKEMTARILENAGRTVSNFGNFNNDVGCPLSLFNVHPLHQFGVFEIGGSARGEVKRLSESVLPGIALVTNIRLEHTATFGTLENIAEGESEIFSCLPEDGTAVLPADDAFFEFMKRKVPSGRRIFGYGFSPDADLNVSLVSEGPDGSVLKMRHRDSGGRFPNEFECFLPVPGRFNALNACAAGAAAICAGAGAGHVVEGLKNFTAPAMRFQILNLPNGAVVVNDSYNANPGSMRSSIEAFVSSFSRKKRVLALGDMLELGGISREEHIALGKYAGKLPVEKILLFGNEARFIAEGAAETCADGKNVVHFGDKDELADCLKSLLDGESAALVKASRGMRMETIIEKIRAPEAPTLREGGR